MILAEKNMITPQEEQKRDILKRSKPLAHAKVARYDEQLAAGKSIAVIQLQYDYACNMFCEHCSISDFRKPHARRSLNPASVKNLADQADAYGLAQIDLTGGEPLIFPDLERVIAAIGPERFYLMVDTNGWEMTLEKALLLKGLGVDKIQLGFDNLDAASHDLFRRKPGAHARAMTAIDNVLAAGLTLQVSTVITPERVHSDEFVRFLEFTRDKGAVVNSIWAKPTGEYATRENLIVQPQDEARRIELCNQFPHLTPPHIGAHFGREIGCLATKKIISITKYGDVMPCIWMYYSLGNIFEMPLAEILAKGMRYFGRKHNVCRTSNDPAFIGNYIEKTRGKKLPIPIEDAMEIPNALDSQTLFGKPIVISDSLPKIGPLVFGDFSDFRK